MWTENEKDIVRRIYPVGGPTECKKMLPKKSIEQIKRYAHTVGLKLVFGARSQWRDDEDAVLREYYLTRNAEFCASILPGRTVAAVRARAKDLRLLRAGAVRPPNMLSKLPVSRDESEYFRQSWKKAEDCQLPNIGIRWVFDLGME